MKLVMALSLLLVSHLSLGQVLKPESSLEVMKAITKSFEKKDLTCYDSVTGMKFKASTMTAFTTVFPNYLDVITVTLLEDQQPSIQFVMKYEDTRIQADVSTNASDTHVVRIHFVNNRISFITTNIGTILRPVFKHEEKITPIENFICK